MFTSRTNEAYCLNNILNTINTKPIDYDISPVYLYAIIFFNYDHFKLAWDAFTYPISVGNNVQIVTELDKVWTSTPKVFIYQK